MKTSRYSTCDLKDRPAQLCRPTVLEIQLIAIELGTITLVDFIFCRRMKMDARCEKSAVAS